MNDRKLKLRFAAVAMGIVAPLGVWAATATNTLPELQAATPQSESADLGVVQESIAVIDRADACSKLFRACDARVRPDLGKPLQMRSDTRDDAPIIAQYSEIYKVVRVHPMDALLRNRLWVRVVVESGKETKRNEPAWGWVRRSDLLFVSDFMEVRDCWANAEIWFLDPLDDENRKGFVEHYDVRGNVVTSDALHAGTRIFAHPSGLLFEERQYTGGVKLIDEPYYSLGLYFLDSDGNARGAGIKSFKRRPDNELKGCGHERSMFREPADKG